MLEILEGGEKDAHEHTLKNESMLEIERRVEAFVKTLEDELGVTEVCIAVGIPGMDKLFNKMQMRRGTTLGMIDGIMEQMHRLEGRN